MRRGSLLSAQTELQCEWDGDQRVGRRSPRAHECPNIAFIITALLVGEASNTVMKVKAS